MALSRHINEEDVLKQSRDHPQLKHLSRVLPHIAGESYAARLGSTNVPKYRIPSEGIDAKAAYQTLHDELTLDGNPILNLASFVTTFMPEEGRQLLIENMDKNLADQDEYPETFRMQTRCISMIANLWKVPKDCKAIGTATGGSSEGILLGGLAMKKMWQQRRKDQGKDASNPNVIFGTNVHCAVEKFARYFDVEARKIPVSESSRFVLSPEDAIKRVDENTIGVILILGSTYNGGFEDVKGMSDLLDEYEAKTGLSVPIHVDAASGGFVAPFVYPKYEWAFSIPRVHSINVSGHKYGLTFVGLGWVIWKDESLLPKELIFELHYLGSTEYSFNLNFSRPAAPVIAQMFNFLNLGFEGYRNIAAQALCNARLLSRALEKSGYYKVVSEIHRPLETVTSGIKATLEKAVGSAPASAQHPETDARSYHMGLPVVAFTLSDSFRQEFPYVKQEWVQNLLRQRGWIVPNYALPPNCENIDILRVVIRESMNIDFVERLFGDIVEVTESLMQQGSEVHMMACITDKTKPQTTTNPMKELSSLKGELEERVQQEYSRTC